MIRYTYSQTLAPAEVLIVPFFEDQDFKKNIKAISALNLDSILSLLQTPDFEGKFLIATISLVASVGALGVFWWFLQKTGDEDLARSVVFTAVGLSTLLYVFSIRSLKTSLFLSNPFKNKYLNGAVLVGLVLQLGAIYWPFLNKALHTQALAWSEWKVILLFLVAVISLIEIIKTIFIFYHKKNKAINI